MTPKKDETELRKNLISALMRERRAELNLLSKIIVNKKFELRKNIIYAYLKKIKEQIERIKNEIRFNNDTADIENNNNQKTGNKERLEVLNKKLDCLMEMLNSAEKAYKKNSMWKMIEVGYAYNPHLLDETFLVVLCDSVLEKDLIINNVTIISSEESLAKKLLNNRSIIRMFNGKKLNGVVFDSI